MNILIYTQWSNYLGYTVGGAETSLRVLAEKLAKNGHNVVYLTEVKGGRFYSHENKTVNGVNLHMVNLPDLPSKGIKIFLWLRQKLIDYYFNKAAKEIINKYNIEIVHTYHEFPGMARFLELKKKEDFEYKTILRNAGKFWVKRISEEPALKENYESVFNDVDSVNFISSGLEVMFNEEVIDKGLNVSLNHRFVKDIGLPLSKVDKQWNPGKKGTFKMVMASRFSTHQKRQELLAEAVSMLPETMNWELHLVGDGPTKKGIQQFVENKGLGKKVIFHAYLEQEKLWDLMSTSNIYVHACDFEGLSKITVEAMRMGMPVLVSDVLPLNNYISDGKNGFLVENSPGSWMEKIQELSESQTLLENVSNPAKRYVENHFNADENVKAYEDYFKRILAGQ